MKKYLFVFLQICVLSSCTQSVTEVNLFAHQETKSVNNLEDEHTITYDNILALTQAQNVGTRSSAQTSSIIECLTNTNNDTLIYVKKIHDGGWIMYASDTRVPAIVAQSERGSFDELLKIEGAKLWIQSIIEDMAMIKALPDEKLNFSKQEIAENKAFWKSISSPDNFVKETIIPKIRDIKDPVPREGHYEFRYSESYTEVYDSISGMTVSWDQNYPYNVYCPLKSDNSNHADAGCVAIAGAQMLYFLHEHYGVPATAPSEAYCYGNINSYTWLQYNYTQNIWGEMTDSGQKAAPLIADIGRRLNMEYGDNGSGAYTRDLVNNVFAPYGISCTYTNYNAELLKNSLLNGMPVILEATSAHSTNTGTENGVHAFIADRYKRMRTVTKNYYEWVYDYIPSDRPIPMIPAKVVYTNSSPYVNMIGMNWGWGSDYNIGSEWYSLTGDWIPSKSPMSQYNWNINRRMIYDFQVINNN